MNQDNVEDSKNYLVLKKLEGHKRVIINHVYPEIDCGRYPIKRCVGDHIKVTADVFADGHDELAGQLLFKHETDAHWTKVALTPETNDSWQAVFFVNKIGQYFYTLKAWVDEFATWQKRIKIKFDALQIEIIDFAPVNHFIEKAYEQADLKNKKSLQAYRTLFNEKDNVPEMIETALSEELYLLMKAFLPPETVTDYPQQLKVIVDRKIAGFSAWYELFPRSLVKKHGQHGHFRDLIQHLHYIKKMGFDIVYLPPIHPIGLTGRKGKNNSLTATASDPGSPWAIGSEEGGHMAIHTQLGSFADFQEVIKATHHLGMEIALDIALQCSHDHPYLKNHTEWFKHRADGSLQYAENPPKKYEDIFPFNFAAEAWATLWIECKNIFLFWIKQGVKIFRVDNVHTKPFIFWEWLIQDIKKIHPDVIFLAEAFTRPKLMLQTAKVGFSQLYTYFIWRISKTELTQYFQELNAVPDCDFLRPNLWPNTPDILHEYLQHGGRPAFIIRFILAATLGTNYGIYGPVYELCVREPQKKFSEEYLHSEKYEIKIWDLEHSHSLQHLIAKVNQIRRKHHALQTMSSLKFINIDNDNLIAYCKHSDDLQDVIIVVVNLDPFNTHIGWITVPLNELGIDTHVYQVHDLLTGASYEWQGSRNYIELNPYHLPAHILHVQKSKMILPENIQNIG